MMHGANTASTYGSNTASSRRPASREKKRPLLVYSEALDHYSFGPFHPMGPRRVRLAMHLAEALGVLEHFDIMEPPPARDRLLRLVHSDEYLAALASGEPQPELGIGDADHPLVPELPRVAARVVSATVAAVEEVWEGRYDRAANIAGGLHHAHEGSMSGFCMFNDAAVAIKWLLDRGATRVAYLDLDAHHGDGVEKIFWDDPRVLTISVHESGLHLFPGTGFANEIGGQRALGTAVNVALPRHTTDLDWLRAVHGIIPPLLQVFKPEIIISQHGADAHRADPLADLDLSMDAMARAYRSVASWADRFARGKWVAIGGGGYLRDSAARAWTHTLAAMADLPLDAAHPTPKNWAEIVQGPVAATMGDPGAEGLLAHYRPDRVLTDAPGAPMVATSRAVFPYWGLRPYHQS